MVKRRIVVKVKEKYEWFGEYYDVDTSIKPEHPNSPTQQDQIELNKMLTSKKIDKYESWRIEEYDIPDDCRHCVNDHNCKTYYGSNECTKKWKEVC